MEKDNLPQIPEGYNPTPCLEKEKILYPTPKQRAYYLYRLFENKALKKILTPHRAAEIAKKGAYLSCDEAIETAKILDNHSLVTYYRAVKAEIKKIRPK